MAIDATEIREGLCRCGCGRETAIIKCSDQRKGDVRGDTRRFIRGHNGRGKNSNWWRGGSPVTTQGYVYVHSPEHPRANRDGYVFQHILIAEAALGKSLPKGVEVHHADGIRSNNTPSNLVICQDRGYHKMIHARLRAFLASGHADYRQCIFCREWTAPENLSGSPGHQYHQPCNTQYYRERYLERRNAA